MENFRTLYKFKLKKNDLHGGLRLKKKKVYQENLISYNYRNILLKQELKINF